MWYSGTREIKSLKVQKRQLQLMTTFTVIDLSMHDWND